MDRRTTLERRIRILLIGFTIGVVISGATAFPLVQELTLFARMIGAESTAQSGFPGWIARVRDALVDTDAKYPFLAYGYDWLAFGHLVIAAAFYGPIRHPAPHLYTVQWGMFCCLASIPLALICGPLRGIPFWWQMIDCSFGLIGIVPLLLVQRDIRELEKMDT
ncbi:hypothetical protein EON82_19555 [bacterium]|nr:MAG: hypothetical protein EON82_19555 [bacterium]